MNMLGRLLAALMLVAASSAVAAEKDRATMSSDIATNFPSNCMVCITAAKLRTAFQDIIDSALVTLDDLGVEVQPFDINTAFTDVAQTWTAAQTFSTTAAGVAFTLRSTDAGTTGGPDVVLDRESNSPAANDVLSS